MSAEEQLENLRSQCKEHCIRSNVTDSLEMHIEVFHMPEGKRITFASPKQAQRS